MDDDAAEAAEKEERRKKHRKRMNKILVRAWNLPNNPFQESAQPSKAQVRDLTEVGKNMDKGMYEHGRSGWELFAKDMGGIYNWHILR
jgi:hypothetical protein